MQKKPRFILQTTLNSEVIPLYNRYKVDVKLRRIDETPDGLTMFRLEVPEKEKDYVCASYTMTSNSPVEITEYESVDPSGGPYIQKGKNILSVLGDYDYIFEVSRIFYEKTAREFIVYIKSISKYEPENNKQP